MEMQPLLAQPRPEVIRNILPIDFSSVPDEPASKERGDITIESMATRLALHPFLIGMNRKHLALLADCATTVQFGKGQVIFREGDLADGFCLIEAGKITVESSGGMDDPMLGWSWMFPPHIRNFTARASDPTTAIFFDGPTLREYCETDHSFGYEFLKRMSLLVYKRMLTARKTKLTGRQRDETLQPTRRANLQESGSSSS